MWNKNIFTVCLLMVCFAWSAKAQFASIEDATQVLNTVLEKSPNGISLTIDDKGHTVKKDGYGVTYEFNLNDVAMINYENQTVRHLVKFACASGSKCFYSDDNFGGGVIHYLEVNTKEEAEKIVAALEYIKSKVNYYFPK